MQSFIVKLAQRIHIGSNSGKGSKVKDTEFFRQDIPILHLVAKRCDTIHSHRLQGHKGLFLEKGKQK